MRLWGLAYPAQKSLRQVEETAIMPFRVFTQLPRMIVCTHCKITAPSPFFPALLLAAPWAVGAAKGKGEKRKEEIQNLSYRLFSCGYSRSAS